MKLDLDAAMAPEMEVSSTVASGNSNNSSDSDQSNEVPAIAAVPALNINASHANLQPSIENQFKVNNWKTLFTYLTFFCNFDCNLKRNFSIHWFVFQQWCPYRIR